MDRARRETGSGEEDLRPGGASVEVVAARSERPRIPAVVASVEAVVEGSSRLPLVARSDPSTIVPVPVRLA